MSNITRLNARFHCRTCLLKLDMDEQVKGTNYLKIDAEIRALMKKYLHGFPWFEIPSMLDVPNMCLPCCNQLKYFERFAQTCERAAIKLCGLWENKDISTLEKDVILETNVMQIQASAQVDNADDQQVFFDVIEDAFVAICENNYSENDENYLEYEELLMEECDPDELEGDDPDELEGDDNIEETVDNNSEDNTTNLNNGKENENLPVEDIKIEKAPFIVKNHKRRLKGTSNPFKCDACHSSFAHKFTFEAHIRKVHEGNQRPFHCNRCPDKAYRFVGGLYTHIKDVHGEKDREYKCTKDGCDRVYTSIVAWQRHTRSKHTEEGILRSKQKRYICEQCGCAFAQTNHLQLHRRSKHPTPDEEAAAKELFPCPICNKEFHTRYTLKYHKLQQHPQNQDLPFECEICGRKMAKKFMLVQHMLIHSTEKMSCPHCEREFVRKFELESHIKAVHLKMRPFQCKFCQESFASRKTLTHHQYIHTGEKPYVCDVCGQAYRQQTCLKNHRKKT